MVNGLGLNHGLGTKVWRFQVKVWFRSYVRLTQTLGLTA